VNNPAHHARRNEETMTIGGLRFPYDHERDTSTHGRVVGVIMRTHPLAMWGIASIVGLIVGVMR
jgi:hypothetical protein